MDICNYAYRLMRASNETGVCIAVLFQELFR